MKNPRVSRRKEILKIRAEINAKETKEKQKEKNQINKIRNETGALYPPLPAGMGVGELWGLASFSGFLTTMAWCLLPLRVGKTALKK